jgi:hypothetical protein
MAGNSPRSDTLAALGLGAVFVPYPATRELSRVSWLERHDRLQVLSRGADLLERF